MIQFFHSFIGRWKLVAFHLKEFVQNISLELLYVKNVYLFSLYWNSHLATCIILKSHNFSWGITWYHTLCLSTESYCEEAWNQTYHPLLVVLVIWLFSYYLNFFFYLYLFSLQICIDSLSMLINQDCIVLEIHKYTSYFI